ncbi:hypothetical protein KOR42_46120 [Thalassoglobus neptunius]|uniref:Uncharacterized protein n=1 Tax=Thalassoglobus neptunius TaxID=1938619 RepID=A0A5C5VW22_9PLAN|nr:hypothetical protein [Thalassoglobus neptunius]TWT42808.1 hypothetical protein KOR42_46120 [Thalassoglobus neptunius]
MSDLSDLEHVSGDELTPVQIRGILNQIDLDITNLVRDGKLAAINYSVAGDSGVTTNRAANLQALLTARQYYQSLLNEIPSFQISQASLE